MYARPTGGKDHTQWDPHPEERHCLKSRSVTTETARDDYEFISEIAFLLLISYQFGYFITFFALFCLFYFNFISKNYCPEVFSLQ